MPISGVGAGAGTSGGGGSLSERPLNPPGGGTAPTINNGVLNNPFATPSFGGSGGVGYNPPVRPPNNQSFTVPQDYRNERLPGFNPQAFNPLSPWTTLPYLNDSFPTLGMLQYFTQAEQLRRRSALEATQMALELGRSPMNYLDWWRLTYGPNTEVGGTPATPAQPPQRFGMPGTPARPATSGIPTPAFMGVNGATAPAFNFPSVRIGDIDLQAPSAQQFNALSPSAQQGMAGYFQRLGIPLEDFFYAITAPTAGMAPAAMGGMTPRR